MADLRDIYLAAGATKAGKHALSIPATGLKPITVQIKVYLGDLHFTNEEVQIELDEMYSGDRLRLRPEDITLVRDPG